MLENKVLNKQAQSMVVDLIIFILMVIMLVFFLSIQIAKQSVDSGVIHSQSFYIQKLMMATLNSQVKEGSYENATVAELIGVYYCGTKTINSIINSTIYNSIKNLNKWNHHFIFIAKDSDNVIAVFDNESCIKIEKISIAKFEMNLPCNKTIEIILGVWPATQKVEVCNKQEEIKN